MRPAFASTRQAAAFALLLLVLLLLPILVGKSLLPSREEIYSSIWWRNGPFPYIHQQIFEEKDDIDIAFVGSSHMLHGIDTPYVQEKLSERLGRPAVVRSICWGGAGFDALYFITQDLLEHRKVHLLVFYDEYQGSNEVNPLAVHWFRFGDNVEALAGLSPQLKATYYLAAILGMPRNLLCLIRPNIPADLVSTQENYCEIFYRAVNPATRLGSMSAKLGFDLDPSANNPNFVEYTPNTGIKPNDASIYSPDTKAQYQFLGPPLPSWQLYFARKFTALAQKHQTSLVLLHLPEIAEMRSPVIQEHEFWPEALHADITMVGIPSVKLFAGMSDEDVRRLFFNPAHLNKNGQEYFTPIITPSLLEIYAAQIHR